MPVKKVLKTKVSINYILQYATKHSDTRITK